MNRLTEKRKKPLITGNEEIIEYRLVRSYDNCINKLGKIEDLMEKYEINSIEELEKDLQVLEILKPLCEVVETIIDGNKRRYLKICGIFAYRIETDEDFKLLCEVLGNAKISK